MSKALYKNPDGSTVELDVIKQYPDGTADLGRGKSVLIEKCKITDEAEHGAATVEGKKAKAPKVPKTDEAKAKQIQEAEAALEAAKIALAAEPTNEALKAELEAAELALNELLEE
jgi:hypothetical protein